MNMCNCCAKDERLVFCDYCEDFYCKDCITVDNNGIIICKYCKESAEYYRNMEKFIPTGGKND